MFEVVYIGKVRVFKDFGGGGFICVFLEMVGKKGFGVVIYVDCVFLRELNMILMEVMIFES